MSGAHAGYDYGNGALDVSLWPDGTLTPGPLPGGGSYAELQPDGSIRAKLGWWREASGKLTIEGERLDGNGPPLQARIPDGYGNQGFQSTLLTFPTAGCWRVVGSVAGQELSFVVRVVAPAAKARQAAAPQVIVTRGAPPSWSCNPRQVARRVLGLLAAVNRGQTARAVRYFSEPSFQWYSVTTPPGVRDDLSHARELDTLASYLDSRHAAGDVLTLDQLRVNNVRRLTELDGVAIRPTRTAAVEVRLRRDATDMNASDPRRYHGKALVACGRPRILMWLIGADQTGKSTRLCPRPARPTPRDAVVACAYRSRTR